MTTYQIVVQTNQKGVRLDAFLSLSCDLSRSRVLKLLEQGEIRLNGLPPYKAGIALKEGDCVELSLPDPLPIAALPQSLPIDILYQDSDIVVVNKARGMVVHPSVGHPDGTLVNALLAACSDLSGIGGELRPGIVHRLDKDTTGLLLIAKNDAAHIALSAQFKQRTVGKGYVALVRGVYKEISGEIHAPIARSPKDRKKMAIVRGGREAITQWQVKQTLRTSTLLDISLVTGRTHQIRVHVAAQGHPVLGDAIYGIKDDKTPVLMLHAYKVTIAHPTTKEIMTFSASPPQDFLDVLAKQGGESFL